MKILILNGSPRKQNTAAMVDAFKAGAAEASNEVCVLHVGKMKIGGCLGCEYCHGKGEGQCVQKDDMGQVIDAYKWADMVVFASPIYYSAMSAQLHAAIQRVYCIGKPAATKAALLLSTATGQTEPVEAYFKQLVGFLGMENCGVCKAVGEENKSEEKMAEIKAWAATLK
ncbi:MAG: flavodoxin family protein [Oscillospiraceae bacterium]|nr:flavodoxin family protein [Oscillospiraceae bacterium]